MENLDKMQIPQPGGGNNVEPAETTSSTMLEDRRSLRRNKRRSSADTRRPKRTYVKHDYEDHYFDPIVDPIDQETDKEESNRRGPRGGVVEPFPSRLFNMLQDAATHEFEDVVSWQPHGRCFIVHDPKAFVEKIMPKYFRQSKLTSFQRQVNLYGFRRLTTGTDRGAYYHELFLRGRPDLHRRMVRMRVKGTGCKSAASPATEPNFYAFAVCKNENQATVKEAPSPPTSAGTISEPTDIDQNPSNEPDRSSDYVACSKATISLSGSNQEQGTFTSSVTSAGHPEYLRDSHTLETPCQVSSMGRHVPMNLMDDTAIRSTCVAAAPNVTSTNEGLPFNIDTSLNAALQMKFTGLNNHTLPTWQQRHHKLGTESNSSHSKAASSNVDCCVRPLAAPRMLPSFQDLEAVTGRTSLNCFNYKCPTNMFASVVSSSLQENTPQQPQGLFWPLSDQEMQDLSPADEIVPLNVSFEDQIRRLLQDPFHHTDYSSDVLDSSRDWQFDPLIIQSEVRL